MKRIAGFLLPLLLGACSSDDSNEAGPGADDGGGGGPDAVTGGNEGGDSGPFEVGVSVVDVSPTDAELANGDIYMGAYGLVIPGVLMGRPAATGVNDPIFARTMVVKRSSDTVVMTILDMPGMSNRVIRAMVAGVTERTGIPRESIYIGSTHSHSAPDFQGLWGSVADAYKQRVIDLTIGGIVDAFEKVAVAELFVSKGTGPNRNRRDWGFTDTELTVLDAKTPDGQRIGTLIQFAAHPVKLGAENLLISRDYTGYTVDREEERLGAPVLYFNGIIGDCSPDGGGEGFMGAQEYGIMVADAAAAAMAAGATEVEPGIVYELKEWRQEVTNTGFQGLWNAGILDYDGFNENNMLSIDTQGGYFRLGTNLQGVAFPGEALTRTGLDIKMPMKADFKLFLGLTTDSLGYFIKSDEWMTGRNGNYEENVSMGQTAGDRAIQMMVEAVNADNASF